MDITYRPDPRISPPLPTWTSGDGREIPLIELDNSHLWNILRFLVVRAEVIHGKAEDELEEWIEACHDGAGDEYPLVHVHDDPWEYLFHVEAPIFAEADRRGFDWRSKLPEWKSQSLGPWGDKS